MRKVAIKIPGLGVVLVKKQLDLGHKCIKCNETIRPGKPGRLCKECRNGTNGTSK